ncbi:shikimate dehydrogenase [Specibacter sp. NPDC057265]|uniref:shikimate dehydrogenase n=1 Tax=Specibacter sp. NPDC057265 TaxID=3346075 RepID=UPI00362AA491
MEKLLKGAVLGHPIGHSKSPALHRAAYKLLGASYDYTALDVQLPQLAQLLQQVRSDGQWYGLSVTMPLKNEAFALVDDHTETAAALGAVNTIVCSTDDAGNIRLLGENTDVPGIANALRHAGVRERPRAAILGGGGTAVAAAAALAQLEAVHTTAFVRTESKGGDVLAVARRWGGTAEVAPFAGAAAALAGFDVVISTLPPHAADKLAAELARRAVGVNGALLLDVAYDPWPSALARAWEACGGVVVAGIEMLLYQGVEQVKLFAGAGGYGPAVAEQEGDVINVMCDALGIDRRLPHEQNMAG